MSDAAIEREYEERLQAETRLLEIWVTYERGERRRVRVFVDTPEGRVIAGKRADEWYELPTVAKVEVVPVGAGGRDGVSSENEVAAGLPPKPAHRATSVPAPTRATCCTPRMLAKPSGKRLCHSLDCSGQPGEPIPIARQHAQGRNWPPYGRVRR